MKRSLLKRKLLWNLRGLAEILKSEDVSLRSCVDVTFHRTSDTRENLFSMLFLITVIKTFEMYSLLRRFVRILELRT